MHSVPIGSISYVEPTIAIRQVEIPHYCLVAGEGLQATQANSALIATPDGVDEWLDVKWDVDQTTRAIAVHTPDGPVRYRFLGLRVWERVA